MTLLPGRIADTLAQVYINPEQHREWEHARRQELREQSYRNLLEKYEIIVERSKAGAQDGDS